MRTDPELFEIVHGERGMLRGIKACIEQECLVSAAVLIYSCIDALAALIRPIGEADTTRKYFKEWVDKYIQPTTKLKCTANDLYGARCGILHTSSPGSSTRRDGHARAVIYYWKDGPDAAAEIPLPSDAIVMTVEDVFDALKKGIDEFFEDITNDQSLENRVEHHKKGLLCYRPYPVPAT